jgi:opacity protein-like surface antigen
MKKSKLIFTSMLCATTLAIGGGHIAPEKEKPVVVENIVDDSSFYLGLGYGNFQEDFDNPAIPKTELEIDTLLFQAGYQYNKYIALEGRYWLGLGDLDVSKAGSKDQDLSGDYDAWGIYIKPMYPVMDSVNIYALLGYASSSLEADNRDYWKAESFSWGVGGEYKFTNNISAFVDYVSLADKDDVKWNNISKIPADITIYTINIGLTYRF